MKNRCLVAASIVLFSTTLWADPQDRVERSFSAATGEKAAVFVETYYQRVATGLSNTDLRRFFSTQRLRQHAELVSRLSQVTGQGQEIEERRVLDLMRMDSKCQTQVLDKTTTLRSVNNEAVLEYSVKNHCATWLPNIQRSVSLRYATDIDSWQIHKVTNQEVF